MKSKRGGGQLPIKVRPTGVVAGRRPRERAHVAELHVVGTRTVQVEIERKKRFYICGDLFSFIFRRHYFIAILNL